MDTFTPFQTFEFDSFTFKPTRYEEYSKGKLLSSGMTNLTIQCKKELSGLIQVQLINNDIKTKIVSTFVFDTLFTLEDRLQLTIFPKITNVQDSTFSILKHIINYTREEKNFSSIEPIVGHIFTNNMNMVKMQFKMANPERLIEFYP